MSQAPIQLEAVRKAYGQVQALSEVSLTVEAGQVMGFVGPNGAGKTTTMRVLLGLLRADGGRVRLLGNDPWLAGPEVLGRVGYLPGWMRFYERMSANRFLDHLARLGSRGATRRRDVAGALGLAASDLRRPVRDLSKGMRQKVGVLQALQHDPDVLVLDEATEGLDPLVQQGFFELLRECSQRGVAILLSSHVLSDIEEVCSRVAIIRSGRVVEVSGVAELRASLPLRARITFARTEDAAKFSLPGAKVDRRDGQTIELRVTEPSGLLHQLAAYDITDLDIGRESLERIVLGYYHDHDEVGG